MSARMLFAMPGNAPFAAGLAAALGCETGKLDMRHFPDGESYLRFESDLRGRSVALVCTLDRPDPKIPPLLFAARTARELGAARVGLVAPYLAYMRQDKAFAPGEAVTSRHMAELLSEHFDWLVTVDPHLHRTHALSEIYTVPAVAVHAAPLLSAWIKSNVAQPFLIGPDSESAQWVSEVARDAGAPFMTLDKTRHADRDVEIAAADFGAIGARTPVLVDDIISSGRTMLAALKLLRGQARPVCVGVHGIFADGSDKLLADAGAEIVTTNTIAHATNRIDVTSAIADAVNAFL